MKKYIYRVIFFIGWLLSPFTLWNDAFVNIPLSYILANIFMKFLPIDFTVSVVVFYWISNILGIIIMYLSGKPLVTNKKDLLKEILVFLATMMAYTVIIVILNKTGLLRPLF